MSKRKEVEIILRHLRVSLEIVRKRDGDTQGSEYLRENRVITLSNLRVSLREKERERLRDLNILKRKEVDKTFSDLRVSLEIVGNRAGDTQGSECLK